MAITLRVIVIVKSGAITHGEDKHHIARELIDIKTVSRIDKAHLSDEKCFLS